MTDDLHHLKVIDISSMVAGPFCAKLLADLGMEVLKIEEPPSGDPARLRGPFPGDVPDTEKSGLFLYLNLNKRGITLNLKTATGQDLFRQLLENADVLIDDHLPQEAEELGLDFDHLHSLNPRLVLTSITPFGQNGPYCNDKAYPLNTFHGGGQGYILPVEPELVARGPLKGGGYVGEYDCGLVAAVGTLGALMARNLLGEGQLVDISKQEAIACMERVDIVKYANDNLIQRRDVRKFMVGGLIPCKDGYVNLLTPEEHQWSNVVDLMGHPDWSKDERCKNEFTRAEYASELTALVAEWSKNFTKDDLYRKAQAKSCPLGPVYTAEDLFQSAQLTERRFFVEVNHPAAGRLPYPSTFVRYSENPWQVRRAAPVLGEYNQEIFCHELGIKAADLVIMKANGVI